MEEELDAETELEESESKITLPVEGTYKIIGTLKNKASPKPEYIEEIVEVHRPTELDYIFTFNWRFVAIGCILHGQKHP